MAVLERFYFDGNQHPVAGFIPILANENDPRSLREQFNDRYLGGWRPFKGFVVQPDGSLRYPGDPPLKPRIFATFRKELFILYDHDWARIIQHDGQYEIARMD